MHKLVAIVGMPGAGKSTATATFEAMRFKKIRFGAVTMEEMQRKELEINEENEAITREALRAEHGMNAYAKLNEPKIKELIKHADVVIDGLYSWQEYLYLKAKFPRLVLLAIYASPHTRYRRLAHREERPLTREESASRDFSEIQNLHKTETIAMADYTVINERTRESLWQEIYFLIKKLEKGI